MRIGRGGTPLAVAVLALAAACSPALTATPGPNASARAAASVGAASASPSGVAASSGSPAATRTARAEVDPSLLDLLPPTVDGLDLAFSAEASDAVVADPALSPDVESVAYGIAVDPESADLLVAAVSRVREASFDDAFFRGWRESYDREVCRQAGGIAQGSLETEIEGRNVFIGSCVNGGNTYHVWMPDRSAILSAVSFGERRLGQRLIETLEE